MLPQSSPRDNAHYEGPAGPHWTVRALVACQDHPEARAPGGTPRSRHVLDSQRLHGLPVEVVEAAGPGRTLPLLQTLLLALQHAQDGGQVHGQLLRGQGKGWPQR